MFLPHVALDGTELSRFTGDAAEQARKEKTEITHLHEPRTCTSLATKHNTHSFTHVVISQVCLLDSFGHHDCECGAMPFSVCPACGLGKLQHAGASSSCRVVFIMLDRRHHVASSSSWCVVVIMLDHRHAVCYYSWWLKAPPLLLCGPWIGQIRQGMEGQAQQVEGKGRQGTQGQGKQRERK